MLDPVAMNISGSLGTRYVSNVFLSPNDPTSDWVIQPQINTSLLWPISDQNSLSVGLGVGYDYYVKTTSYRSFYLTPGSDISLDLYVKDFVINLHSNFTLTQDPTYEPSVSRQGSLPQFINQTGTQVDWDLNKLVLTFNFDHVVDIFTEESQSYQSYQANLFALRASTKVHPAVTTGLELGGGMTEYDPPLNDHSQISVGPMIQWQVTQKTSLRAAGGYGIYMFGPGEYIKDLPNFTGFYGVLSAQQQLTRNVSHSLSGGKQLQVNTRGFPLDNYFAHYQVSLNVIRHVGLSLGFLYQNGTEYYGIGERFNWIGLTASVNRQLTQRISAQLTYQGYWKMSQINAYDYTQNNIALQATYRF